MKEKSSGAVPVVVDPYIGNKLRPHQREGVIFMYESIMGLRGHNFRGCLLADEMGLGKTLQVIALLWTVFKQGPQGKPALRRAVVTCPSSLVENWGNERFLKAKSQCPKWVVAMYTAWGFAVGKVEAVSPLLGVLKGPNLKTNRLRKTDVTNGQWQSQLHVGFAVGRLEAAALAAAGAVYPGVVYPAAVQAARQRASCLWQPATKAVRTVSGADTAAYSKEQEDRAVAILRGRGEKKEKRELERQVKKLAVREEELTRKRKMEEEMEMWKKEQEAKHGVIEAQLVQLFYNALPEQLRGHYFDKKHQSGMTYDVLGRDVASVAQVMPVTTFWHKDLTKGKKWKGRTISGQVKAKDNLILTMEGGGAEEVSYTDIEWGLEEEGSSAEKGSSYLAVVVGGRSQRGGRGRGNSGPASSGRGQGGQGVGGNKDRQAGGRGQGPPSSRPSLSRSPP
ncbi:hypothetical protein CBR_g40174 [Chara braunii]|uniref:SNF2 N-terminal domain-containing protein n=1 Tax=Chara braunii TaxID=69332 RepID=A0A388LT91_CHABU|nr:hypothetical protein CBR_g40174 [Chara braunii]|eukprot:GBG85536.1 hypothetical protein CBR_g40174 [Chara braunii]